MQNVNILPVFSWLVGQDEPQALRDGTISDQDFLRELLPTDEMEERAAGALDEDVQAPAEPFECVSVFSGADSQQWLGFPGDDFAQLNLQVLEDSQTRSQAGQQSILGTDGRRLDSSHRLATRRDDSRSHHRDGSELASIPHLHADLLEDLNSQQPTLPWTHPDTRRMLECDADSVDSGDNPLSPAQVSYSGPNLHPLNPEPHLATCSSLSSQPESSAKQQENTAVQTVTLESAVLEDTVVEPAAGPGRTSDPENAFGLKVAQSLTPQSETGAWTQDKPPQGLNVTGAVAARIPKVLDREPKAGQINNSCGSGLKYLQGAELCEAKPKVPLNLGSAETGSSLCPAMISVETGQTGSGSPEDESTPASFTSDLENTRRARGRLSRQRKVDALQLVHADRSASPDLHGEVYRLAGARAAGATFLQVSHVSMTDLCHAEQQTMSSAPLNPVEGGQGHAESSTSQQVCLASGTPATAGAASAARAEEINPRVPSESESCQSEAVHPSGRGEQEPASGEESLQEVSSVEDTKVNVHAPATQRWHVCVRTCVFGVGGGAPIPLSYTASIVLLHTFQWLPIPIQQLDVVHRKLLLFFSQILFAQHSSNYSLQQIKLSLIYIYYWYRCRGICEYEYK